jgi:hypothetical protein
MSKAATEPIPVGICFGLLTTSSEPCVPEGSDRKVPHVEVQCDCGTILSVPAARLRTGKRTTCGCSRPGRRKPIPVGTRYGRYVTTSDVYHRDDLMRGQSVVDVRCDCGTTRTVRVTLLRGGQTKSCGCLKPEPKTRTTS